MTDIEPRNQNSPPVPDPEELWADTQQAADILHRSRATVYDMALRGVITPRYIGRATVYYRPELHDVAVALRRLEVRS